MNSILIFSKFKQRLTFILRKHKINSNQKANFLNNLFSSVFEKEKFVNRKNKSMFFLMAIFLISGNIYASEKVDSVKTALLLIDVQNFYFPGGKLALFNPEKASLKARQVLKKFRKEKKLVIHIRHNSKSGGEIHKNVKPALEEKVISKNHANSFRDTDLLIFLKKNKIQRLVICGMMTHMCVEATTRAAHDYGFDCIVIQDACTTRDLKFNDKIIKAEDVHYSTLSSLSGYYAKVVDLESFMKDFK